MRARGHNIEEDLNEIGCEGVGWIQVVHIKFERLYFGNTLKNLQIPCDKY
jgi:hypothetical protein